MATLVHLNEMMAVCLSVDSDWSSLLVVLQGFDHDIPMHDLHAVTDLNLDLI